MSYFGFLEHLARMHYFHPCYMLQPSQVLGFYMGKNTPERREYIMKNLIEDAG
jgi:hypothetical protein